MKMQRGGSSDSLDNGIGDRISSSSSGTDFTSDDESNALYIMSGQPAKSKPKLETSTSLANRNQSIIDDKLLQHNHSIYPQANSLVSTRRNICVAADRPISDSTGGPRDFGSLYNNPYSSHPSTSIYSDIENSSLLGDNLDLLYSDRVSEQVLAPILPDETYTNLDGGRQVNSTTTNPAIRPNPSSRRSLSENRSNNDASENCFASSSGFNSYGLSRGSTGYDCENEESRNVELFRHSDRRRDIRIIDSHISSIAGPSRQANHTIAAMCARLVECRSLGDAIDFVGSNRDLIDNLTRVIREAPAYRNYDMSSYQIDYSIKESFNPEFWHDREPVVTTADGNCQYHAVSISLTGSEIYTQEVRLLTAVTVIDYLDWFDSILKIIDGGTVLDLVHTIARSYSWGDATTLKAIAVAIKRRIFLYTCNTGKKDYEMVKSLTKEELLDAFKEKKYRGGTGIHTYADPLVNVPAHNYIMLFHKSEHFIAVLPTTQNPIMYEPYNPIVPTFS